MNEQLKMDIEFVRNFTQNIRGAKYTMNDLAKLRKVYESVGLNDKELNELLKNLVPGGMPRPENMHIESELERFIEIQKKVGEIVIDKLIEKSKKEETHEKEGFNYKNATSKQIWERMPFLFVGIKRFLGISNADIIKQISTLTPERLEAFYLGDINAVSKLELAYLLMIMRDGIQTLFKVQNDNM